MAIWKCHTSTGALRESPKKWREYQNEVGARRSGWPKKLFRFSVLPRSMVAFNSSATAQQRQRIATEMAVRFSSDAEKESFSEG